MNRPFTPPEDVPPSDCNDGECHNCKYEFDCVPLTEEEKKDDDTLH